MAIAGDVAIAGAPLAEEIPGLSDHGIIEVSRYNPGSANFGLGQTITAPDAAAGDHFGAAVATDGTSIAIGAPDDDLVAGQVPGATAKTGSGCAYIFRWVGGGWTYDGRVFASDASDQARFGNSIAIDGDLLAVAAPGAKLAYLFRRHGPENWVQVARFSDPDGSADGAFGAEVALAAGEVGIGDPSDDHAVPSPGTTNQGAAYTFAVPQAGGPSDHCELAGAVAGHGSYSGCTASATLSGSASCGGGGVGGYGPDVWYSWTPACSGNVIMDTIGSDFDTVLSVHTGCPGGAANTIACNDDAPNYGVASQLSFNYAAGQTYLIRISGFGRQSGNFVFRIVDWYAPQNETCASAQTVGSGTTAFATCRANSTYLGPACMTGADMQKDVWFRYTAPCTGTVKVDTCGSTFDTMLQVFPAPTCPFLGQTPLVCSDDVSAEACPGNSDSSAASFAATAGQSFYIRVGGRASAPKGDAGDGVLNIACAACPCDWNDSGSLSVQDIFDFLAAYFSGSADFNSSGQTTVQDIFDFLACYFGGCA